MPYANSDRSHASIEPEASVQTSPPLSGGAFISGFLVAIILAALWALLAMIHLVPAPSLALLGKLVLPLFGDFGSFIVFNSTHNLIYILMVAVVVACFEILFRQSIARGRSPGTIVSVFKALSLLLGIMSLAISLPGALEAGMAAGKAAIGQMYYKFGLFVLGAIIIMVRHIVYLAAQPPRNS